MIGAKNDARSAGAAEGKRMKTPGRVVVLLALAGLVAMVVTAAFASEGEMVVVSRPGVVFHKAGSGDVRGRGVEKPIDQALASGYVPCTFCFARTASAGLKSGATLGATVGSSVSIRSIALPPGLRDTTFTSQPFGVRFGALHAPGLERMALRDPFDPVSTILNPAKEQGAYGTPGKGVFTGGY